LIASEVQGTHDKPIKCLGVDRLGQDDPVGRYQLG
jgi:hypothetical protein